MLRTISFPFWPVKPFFNLESMAGLVALVGIVFTVIMLIDCIRREPAEFGHPISGGGKYDKIIWSLAMVMSLSLYFLGTIVYFFTVYRGSRKS